MPIQRLNDQFNPKITFEFGIRKHPILKLKKHKKERSL
jgi:hypothetical protein